VSVWNTYIISKLLWVFDSCSFKYQGMCTSLFTSSTFFFINFEQLSWISYTTLFKIRRYQKPFKSGKSTWYHPPLIESLKYYKWIDLIAISLHCGYYISNLYISWTRWKHTQYTSINSKFEFHILIYRYIIHVCMT
jgi:hypothetical protein